MTLPTLTVLLDDGTGTFPYNVTNYVMFDDGYTYNRGRDDWQGGVNASQLSLTFNNSDGRFTPGSTLIASPSPIKVDARIRVKETINGTTFTVYTGYVKSWPVEWPATVQTIAMSSIAATDAQARAERQPLRSIVDQEILADSPSAYYAMHGLASDTTGVADISGNQVAPLSITGFGTAPSFDDDGVTFANGQYLVGPNWNSFGTYEVAFKTTASGTIQTLLGDYRGAQFLAVTAAGKLAVYDSGVAAFTTTASVNDGNWHVAAFIGDNGGGFVSLYLDGVNASGALSSISPNLLPIRIGSGFTGTISNVILYNSFLLAGDMSAHATAILTGFAGESGTARLTRLAGYANLPLGTLDASLTNVAATDLTGVSAWDAIQAIVDAEGGVAFIDENGTLEFHNRNRVPTKTTPDLTLAATSFVTPDVSPVLDDQQIVNYFEATSDATGVVQVARSTTSETAHGRYASSQSYLVTTDSEALDRANWVVNNFAEPSTRYGTLTFNLFKMTPSQAATVLTALDLDCWVRVPLMASQNPGGTTVDVVVEGFTKTCTSDSWFVTCNVVSLSLFRAWILENATYGVLDSTTEVYY